MAMERKLHANEDRRFRGESVDYPFLILILLSGLRIFCIFLCYKKTFSYFLVTFYYILPFFVFFLPLP